MTKIGLIGGAGCGKSTQCADFYASLKSDSIQVEQVQEWVREAFNKNLLPEGNPWVQFWIYEEQKIKEDCIPKEIKYIVTDSPTLLSYVYALKYAKRPEDNYLIIKMYEKFINDIGRYDFIFLCKREKPYIKDGTRKQTKEEAEQFDKDIIYLLEQHRIPYTLLEGKTKDRTKKMREVIGV